MRPEADRPHEAPPPMIRGRPLIIEGDALTGSVAVRGVRPPADAPARSELRRYGIAAGAAVLVLALVAVVLLAPDVSALPGLAFLEGSR